MFLEGKKSTEEEFPEKKEEKGEISLEDFLAELRQEGINTLPEREIKEQLSDTGVAIVTRDFDCGIRISKRGSKYRSWTTNVLENPDHPLAKKFRHREIIIG